MIDHVTFFIRWIHKSIGCASCHVLQSPAKQWQALPLYVVCQEREGRKMHLQTPRVQASHSHSWAFVNIDYTKLEQPQAGKAIWSTYSWRDHHHLWIKDQKPSIEDIWLRCTSWNQCRVLRQIWERRSHPQDEGEASQCYELLIFWWSSLIFLCRAGAVESSKGQHSTHKSASKRWLNQKDSEDWILNVGSMWCKCESMSSGWYHLGSYDYIF